MRKYGLTICLALASVGFSKGQNYFLDRVKDQLSSYQRSHPVEKVYLHVDRSYYASGETIWFKVYSAEGPHHVPSNLSENVYVELIRPDGALFSRVTIRLIGGMGSGHLILPDSATTGYYRVRGYTNWMQNFGAEFAFQREVPVFDLSEKSIPLITQPGAIDLQFFPEGGDWVAGLESVVGFKAINSLGEGIPVRGKVFDNQGQWVASFESSRLGMGKFSLKPEIDNTYYAIIDQAGAQKFSLPNPKREGYTLTVTNSRDSKDIPVRIQTNISHPDSRVTTVAHCRGLVLFSTESTIAYGQLNGAISTEVFQSGVNCITIFDQEGHPLAERVFFVDRHDNLVVEAVVNKREFEKREKVTIDLETKDSGGNPVRAFLSLSATDESLVVQDNDNEDIASYLLLRSDLAGHIENPGYYFNEENDNRWDELDNLMLTQGWRRFNWDEVLGPSPTQTSFSVEKGFTISGVLRDDYTNKPKTNARVSFLSKDSTGVFGIVETDEQGRFSVSELYPVGDMMFLFQGEFRKNRKDVWFDFDSVKQFLALPPPSKSNLQSILEFQKDVVQRALDKKKADATFDRKENTLLEVVTITAPRLPELRMRTLGPLASIMKFHEIKEIGGMVHPVQLVQKFGYQARNLGMGSYRPWHNGKIVGMYWDGVPIGGEEIDFHAAAQVESISFLFGEVYFWSKVLGSGYDKKKVTKRILPGYQRNRKFYSPKYDQAPTSAKPDYRVTLHWQPEIVTDENGRARVEFYTSDLETEIAINVEGLSTNGAPGVVRRKIKVKSDD